MKPLPPCLPTRSSRVMDRSEGACQRRLWRRLRMHGRPSRMHAGPLRMRAVPWKSGASASRKAHKLFEGLQPWWSCLLVLLCLSATAQTPTPRTPATYKLIAVKVTGSQRFTSEEVASASGLPVGTILHEEDFKKAARQLGESGAFNSVAFTYNYTTGGTKLEFQVIDADKF